MSEERVRLLLVINSVLLALIVYALLPDLPGVLQTVGAIVSLAVMVLVPMVEAVSIVYNFD